MHAAIAVARPAGPAPTMIAAASVAIRVIGLLCSVEQQQGRAALSQRRRGLQSVPLDARPDLRIGSGKRLWTSAVRQTVADGRGGGREAGRRPHRVRRPGRPLRPRRSTAYPRRVRGPVPAGVGRDGMSAKARLPALDIAHLSKAYGLTHALDDVLFSVQRGELHALIGANGSGKTTLVKVVAGVARGSPGGVIRVGDASVAADRITPAWSRRAGVRVVHQDLAVFADLTIAENVALCAGFAVEPGEGDRLARGPSAHRRAPRALRDRGAARRPGRVAHARRPGDARDRARSPPQVRRRCSCSTRPPRRSASPVRRACCNSRAGSLTRARACSL